MTRIKKTYKLKNKDVMYNVQEFSDIYKNHSMIYDFNFMEERILRCPIAIDICPGTMKALVPSPVEGPVSVRQ